MKAFLKAAREALNSKDYDRVISIVDTGLAADEALEPEHATSVYTLLVFKALALHNLGRNSEAIEFYEKAAISNPSMPLAWQGLVSLYDATKAEAVKFIRPLEALLPIYQKSDEQKYKETVIRLLPIYEETKYFAQAKCLFEWLLSDEASKDERPQNLLAYIKLREAADEDYVQKEVQKRKFRLGAGPLPVIKAQVESELAKTSDIGDWYEQALDLLPEGSERNALLVKVAKFLATKVDFMESKDEKKAAWERIQQIGNQIFDEDLFELVLDSSDPAILNRDFVEKYVQADNRRLYKECLYFLGKSNELELEKTSLFSAWMFSNYSWSKLDYESYLSSLPVLKTLFASCEAKFANDISKSVLAELNYREFVSLVRTERFEAASRLMSNFDEKLSEDIFEAKFAIFEALGKFEDMIKLLEGALESDKDNIKHLSNIGWCNFQLKQYSTASSFLEKALSLAGEDAMILYRLGRVNWALGQHEQSLNLFLRTVKVNTEHAEAFLYLGKGYATIRSDLVRAEKCFSKALKLDNSLVDAAVSLASIWINRSWKNTLTRLETGSKVVSILEPFKSENLRNWQLWKYIGIAYSWTNFGSKATSAFQTALKAEHADELECLLLLADAYRRDKKLSAAGKAYSRALAVKPDSVLAKIGLATVKLETKAHQEAINLFVELSELSDEQFHNDIKCFLAKTHLSFAKELILQSDFEQAIENIKSGFKILSSFASESNSFSVWKTFAELCQTSVIFAKHSKYEELTGLATSVTIDSELPIAEEISTVLNEPLLKSSALSYMKCLSLTSNDAVTSDIWLSIGQLTFQTNLDLAETCVTQSLNHNSSHPEAWNLYGLIALEQGRHQLSQHCFITSLEHADTSHVWINLALLYVRLGDTELALQAIERAQMSDVENPLSWFAQAQLEASISKMTERLTEAIQCEKASTNVLMNEIFISLTWPKLVETKDRDEKRILLEQLLLALKRVCVLKPGDSFASNLYGLALERTRQPCSDYFSVASNTMSGDKKQIATTNLYRALVVSHRFKESSLLVDVKDDRFTDFLRGVEKAYLINDISSLKTFINKASFESCPQLWESAVWEFCKVSLVSGRSVEKLSESLLEINPSSISALTFRMVSIEDSTTAEALLMQLIEILTFASDPIAPDVLWLTTKFLQSRGCYAEALQLHMSILESNIMDVYLWEALAVMLDEIRTSDSVDENVKAEVVQSCKQWIDVHVPQLQKKPTLEQIETWYDRLFPVLEMPI